MGRSARTQHFDELYSEGGVSRPQHFDDCLGREIERARRYGTHVSLLLIGFDEAARMRERGDAADAAGKALGELVRKHTRATDVVGLHARDQVAVLLPETDEKAAFMLGERLRRAIARRPVRGAAMRTSVGVSSYRPDAEYGTDALMFEAESALDAARRAGGSRVVLFSA